MKTVVNIPALPHRPDDAHKSMVGRIMIVAGSMGDCGMAGAAGLTANAALRGGAGLVCVATQREAMGVVSVLAPCATTMALDTGADLNQMAIQFGADVLAIGPGLARTVSGEQIIDVLNRFSGAVVLDADALNVLAETEWSAKWPHKVVLTPHPGEMQRLLKGGGDSAHIQDREKTAYDFACKTGTVVVLKGMGTVVADPTRVYVNQTGNSGMATGGSGDVLTGVIAALLGQKMEAFEAAVLGVHMHGLAGDFAAEELGRISLTAVDLIEFLPEAACDLQERHPF